ncbi:MAG TPA: peptide deformylase [Bacilli bacterium]|nr:peptide deformylase [Bacilli bacterium]
MAIRQVVLAPADVLRQIAKPVEKIDEEILTLLDDMADTMYDENGIGLAAPQVGVSKRVVIIDFGEEYGGLLELINPVIVEKSGSVVDVEGCLSIPNLRGNVKRYDKITVHFMARDGKTYEMKPDGYFARIFQHEIDHLEGILYTDLAIDTFEIDEEGNPIE